MNITKRKVIKQGNNTLTITLPRKWTEELKIKSGDELELSEDEYSNLILGKELHTSAKEANVHFGEDDHLYARSHIGRLYRFGFTTIHITFDDPSVFRDIEHAVNSLIGADIIESSEKRCTIKIYPVHEEQVNIDQHLIKMFTVLKYVNSVILEDISKSSFKSESELRRLRDNNWKIKDLILRVIFLKHVSYEEYSILNQMLFAYEKIGTTWLKSYRLCFSRQKEIRNASRHKELFGRLDKVYDDFIHILGKQASVNVSEETQLRQRIRKFHEELLNVHFKDSKLDHSLLYNIALSLELLDSTDKLILIHSRPYRVFPEMCP